MKTPNITRHHLPKTDGKAWLAPVMLFCGLSALLPAQSVTWNGPADGDWFNAANWTGGAPTSSSAVFISGAGPLLTSGTAYAGTFDLATSGAGTFVMRGDSAFYNTGIANIGSGIGTLARMTMSGSATWSNAGGVYLGLTGTGQIDMTDNARIVMTSGFMSLGRNGGGLGILNMTGNSSFSINGQMFLGDGVNASGGYVVGTINMRDSSYGYINTDLSMGRQASSTGNLFIYDSSTLTIGRSLVTGSAFAGTIVLSGGSGLIVASNTVGTVTIGDGAHGTGSITVRDNATLALWRTGNMIIGNAGTGVITVEGGGARLMASAITIASGSTSTGALIITGATAGRVSGTNGASAITITGGAGSAGVVFDHSDASHTFANNLAGSLSVEHKGAGYTQLTGSNTYTGATIVSAGTLAGSTASLRGDITNNATVIFNQTTTGTYSGAMSGDGTLSKTGAGALELAGDFTAFNGSLIIREGLLRMNDTIAAGMKSVLMTSGTYDGNWSATGATRTFTGAGTITGGVSLTNATLVVGGDILSTGVLTIQGDMALSNATLTFGCAGGGSSDSINLLGTLSASGSNTIDIAQRGVGINIYNLGNIAALATARLTIYGAENLNSRISASLSASGSDLLLTVNSDISRALTWTGNTDAQWNFNASNWAGSESTTQFAPGDTVVFSGTADAANPARRVITLGAGQRTVSDMLVTGNADYTFAGDGGISADAGYAAIESGNPNGLAAPAGKLLKTGANILSFENTGGNNFAGGMEIAGGALAFNRADQLGTTGVAGDAGIRFTATGTLVANAENMTLPNKIIIAPGATATLDTQSHNLTYSGNASDGAANGTFVKRGDGRLTVTGEIAAENLQLAQGEILVAPAGRIAATGILVDENTVWLGGGNITAGLLTNHGNIRVGKAGGAAAHGSMTITGDYDGDGGKIWLDMAVNAARTGIDHDQLIITGDATGVTLVSFQNEPDPNPLPANVKLPILSSIITVEGDMAGGAFQQDGIVEFGGIAYRWDTALDTWVPDTTGAARALACMDAAAILIGKASFDSLQRRLMFTRARQANTPRKMEMWAGAMHRHEKLGGSMYKDATADTQGIQAGVDWITMRRDRSLVFGLYCDHAISDMDLAGKMAATRTEATGIGLYLSWGRGPWYADAMLRRAVEHYDISPRIGGRFLSNGTSWTGALAAGITMTLAGAWQIEPQAQLTYQEHTIEDAADASARVYRVKSADSLDGRAGVRLWRDIFFANNTRRLSPYARASLSYEFQGNSTITVSDATFRNNLGGMVAMLDAGAELALGKKWSLNAAGALFNGSKTAGYSLGAGIRYSW